MKEMEEEIQLCYSEPVNYDSDDLLKMILVDACFIIELFLRSLRSHSESDWEGKDPLF